MATLRSSSKALKLPNYVVENHMFIKSEQGLHTYGTPLPHLELDEVPSKKPLYAQDQIATDEQGRRRFHGAFTGGFSAGYWNTVGSKEGWTPQSFKSSRSEKAGERVSQRPEDFMDDEDRGEFGIAPKGLEIHEDFTAAESSKERKRKFLQTDMKPIPGEPVLQQLLRPIKDKVSVRILKAWGWRPGQGVGTRQTRKEKKKARERNKKELYLMEKYGCDLPSTSKLTVSVGSDDEQQYDDDDDDTDEEEITFAPEDYEAKPYGYKEDHYGIGYKPLSRQSVLGSSQVTATSTTTCQKLEHINLFKPLEAIGKNNQKISFAGQGFGVGALEEDDDEDVYATDDLTRYDFTLEDKKKAKKANKTLQKEELVFEDFVLDLNPEKPPDYKVEVPFGWQPRNWYQKRSRFEPMDPRTQRNLERKMNASQKQSEQEMTREKRAELLGEKLKRQEESTTKAKSAPQSLVKPSIFELQKQQKERQEKTKSLLEKISAKSSSFTTGGIITLEGEEKSMSSLTAEEISGSFKPFLQNPEKQKRYEQFLAKTFNTEVEMAEFLKSIQPVELSLWDRQMEQKEFIQAKKLYRPLQGIMSDRFVTESQVKAEQKVIEIKRDESKQIVVERTKTMWKPHSLLCKRFNIAEPYGGRMEDEKKSKNKTKMSIFDYLETSVNKKEDFQTPVIIPKHIEKSQEIVKQTSKDPQPEDIEKHKQVSLEWQNVLEGKQERVEFTKTAPTFKPKTELERKVVESLDKPLTEKRELFKSIFSGSESDSEEDWDSEKQKTKYELMASLGKPVSAAAANLLRNNSPPRGIFKALFNAPGSTVDLTKEKEASIDLTNNKNYTIDLTNNKTSNTMIDLTNERTLHINDNQKDIKEFSKSVEKERILFKPKTSREPKDDTESFNTYENATPVSENQKDIKEFTKSMEKERILFKSKTSREPKDNTESFNTYGPALPCELIRKIETQKERVNSEIPSTATSLDAKLMSLWKKHKTATQVISSEVWVERGSMKESSDSADDSTDDDDDDDDSTTTSSEDDSKKHKKKSKKSKKKKSSSSSDHKHKKHKDHKSSKKSKKSDKKKKKHKKK